MRQRKRQRKTFDYEDENEDEKICTGRLENVVQIAAF